jgi:hypothetical protein
MRRIFTALLFTAFVLAGGTAHASGTAPIWVATPHAPIQTKSSFDISWCQFDVYKGVLMIGVRGEQNAGRYVSVIVVNNSGSRAVALHGYLHAEDGDALWFHNVWHTYTQLNIAKAWVSGHRCEGT